MSDDVSYSLKSEFVAQEHTYLRMTLSRVEENFPDCQPPAGWVCFQILKGPPPGSKRVQYWLKPFWLWLQLQGWFFMTSSAPKCST